MGQRSLGWWMTQVLPGILSLVLVKVLSFDKFIDKTALIGLNIKDTP